jgi:anti-anti-sigma factor
MRLADVRVEQRNRVVVASVEGEIDLSNADELGTSLATQMTNDALGLAIDLSGVRYMDSAGIQVVYELRERLRNRGQKLRLVVPADCLVARTLELVNASETLGIVDTADAAVAALGSSEGVAQ